MNNTTRENTAKRDELSHNHKIVKLQYVLFLCGFGLFKRRII